jgi:hypothetical protein
MRLLTRVRVTYGTLLLLRPRLLTKAIPMSNIDGPVIAFARLLGARHLLEAAVLSRRRAPVWTLAGAAVDATHATTMVVLAVRRPIRRSLAIANALAAASLATAGTARVVCMHDCFEPRLWTRGRSRKAMAARLDRVDDQDRVPELTHTSRPRGSTFRWPPS